MNTIKLCLVLSLFSASNTLAEAPPKDWQKNMQILQKSLQEVLTDVASDERFYDPSRFSAIQKNVEEFARLAQDVSANAPLSPDGDPTIGMIASEFSKEAKHANQVLKFGQRTYARQVLRSMTQYCIACHTKNFNGPQFSGLTQAPSVFGNNSIEKANYLASVREFDQAIKTYQAIIDEGKKSKSVDLTWEKSVRMSLAIAVRVKSDADLALKIIDSVLSTAHAPYYLKEQAQVWKKSLESWKKETKSKSTSPQALFETSKKLIEEGKKLQKFPMDRSGDVLFLRASAMLHDYLNTSPSPQKAAEAFYWAGLSYEILGSSDLWDLSQLYYLGCIAKAPLTVQSRKCYRQYEEKVYFNYSGSSGLHLPEDVKAQLDKLDQLSIPQNQKPKIDRTVH